MTIFATFFQIFRKKGMLFHENRLAVDNSHEVSCLICYFGKAAKMFSAANYRWQFMGYIQ